MTDARLTREPVFILSTVRSGSTLLRCILNSHPDVCAPHELHLRHLGVHLENEYVELAMTTAGLAPSELEYMLWDRLLHRLLTASGKRRIVDKSPSNIWIWRRLLECWPDARFILLRRHPGAIVESIVQADDGRDRREATRQVVRAVDELDQAGRSLPRRIVVRYEALTADPTTVTKHVCNALGVPWAPAMLDYGRHDHGPLVYGIGDWSERIQSGHVQPARPAPPWSELSGTVRKMARRWDYEPDSELNDDHRARSGRRS